MLSKVVERLQKDQTRDLVIAPLWRTQDWFPKMSQMLISQPVLLQKEESLLQVTHDMTKVYPLWPKLQLMACCLLGQDSDIKRFQHKLAMSSWMSLDKWRNFARTKNENPIHSTVAKVTVLSFWHTCMTLEAAIQHYLICIICSSMHSRCCPYTMGEYLLIKQ